MGSVWSLYSVINNYFCSTFKKNLNSDQPICTLLEIFTKNHVPKKSDIIKWDLVQDLLDCILKDDDPKDLI